MSKTIVVEGTHSLNGEVVISGSKNCALTLLAAALLCPSEVHLLQIPDILDVRQFLKIFTYLDIPYTFKNHQLDIFPHKLHVQSLNIEEVHHFRASYYLIGALLHAFKKLEIAHCGGCNFTNRPINYHRDFFRNFGVSCTELETYDLFEIKEEKGGEYTLPYPSFGASINACLFAVASQQEIIVHNVAEDVEFEHFISFLKAMGADILFDKQSVYIKPSTLHSVTFKNIPDRIETGTFLFLGVTNCTSLVIKNIVPLHNKALLDMFSLLDIDYELGDDEVHLHQTDIHHSVFVETGLKDLISSDLQPLLTVFCLNIPRISVIKEKVYNSRFTHIKPLQKMGAFISEANQNILINGIMELVGTEVTATDLRMAAAMVYAGLSAKGISKIYHAEYIDRGYENFVEKLKSLGANIKVYEEK